MLNLPGWLRLTIFAVSASWLVYMMVQFGLSKHFYSLGERAEAAYREGRLDEARTLANEELSLTPLFYGNWNRGNAIHGGHAVLGLVALSEGDVATARSELLAAGVTPGSPQLDTFGPDLELAAALVTRGEHSCVVEYLASCRRFWKMEDGRLDLWTADLSAGRSPDFRARPSASRQPSTLEGG